MDEILWSGVACHVQSPQYSPKTFPRRGLNSIYILLLSNYRKRLLQKVKKLFRISSTWHFPGLKCSSIDILFKLSEHGTNFEQSSRFSISLVVFLHWYNIQPGDTYEYTKSSAEYNIDTVKSARSSVGLEWTRVFLSDTTESRNENIFIWAPEMPHHSSHSLETRKW